MSKIWRPMTSHTKILEQKPQDKKHAQKSHPAYSSGSESQVPDSAIVTCSSTNIETCRSLRSYKTNKTTHTCLRFEITCLSEDQAWAWHRGSVAFGSERNSCFSELRRTTHTQDHKRVVSTRQRTDSLCSDSCPRFGMTSFSKDQALMFLLVDKHKNKQTARPQTDNAARTLRMQ